LLASDSHLVAVIFYDLPADHLLTLL
jgi:hypothetical protein